MKKEWYVDLEGGDSPTMTIKDVDTVEKLEECNGIKINSTSEIVFQEKILRIYKLDNDLL